MTYIFFEKYFHINWKYTYLVLFCRPYHRKSTQMDGDSHVPLIHELYNLFYQWKPYHNLCIYAFSLRNVLKYVDSNIVENWKLLHKWHIWNPKKEYYYYIFLFKFSYNMLDIWQALKIRKSILKFVKVSLFYKGLSKILTPDVF